MWRCLFVVLLAFFPLAGCDRLDPAELLSQIPIQFTTKLLRFNPITRLLGTTEAVR
ncbi:MAG: hypothetical protein AB4290_07775 [Spirulina sp.]